MEHYDIVIIGAGPAGMAAAYGAYRAGERSILVVDRNNQAGGILPQCLHDGFGIYLMKKSLSGPEYAAIWRKKIAECGIVVHTNTTVLSIDYKTPFILSCISSVYGCKDISADSIIFATGCRERSLGAMRIPGSRPSGIYTAGTAQYMMNMQNYKPGKNIVILGSGDIGLIMARRFTLEGSKVKLVLGERSSGLLRNHVQCIRDYDIPIVFGYTVVSVHGYKRLKGVTIAPVDEKGNPILEQKKYICCDTLLVAAGLIQETELWTSGGFSLSECNGISVDENGKTPIEGIYACGNTVKVYDLVDSVSQDGEKTGMAAAKWILAKKGIESHECCDFENIEIEEPRGNDISGLKENEIVCTLCPSGCKINVLSENTAEGYNCPNGLKFALEEMYRPMRTVTTSVKIMNGTRPLLPVRTDIPIDKSDIKKVIEISKKITVKAPIKVGDIIAGNVSENGAKLIATDDINCLNA